MIVARRAAASRCTRHESRTRSALVVMRNKGCDASSCMDDRGFIRALLAR